MAMGTSTLNADTRIEMRLDYHNKNRFVRMSRGQSCCWMVSTGSSEPGIRGTTIMDMIHGQANDA